MTSNLFTIGRMSDNKLKCNYLKYQQLFLNFSFRSWNLYEILTNLKNKHEPSSVSISEIFDSERGGYLNV